MVIPSIVPIHGTIVGTITQARQNIQTSQMLGMVGISKQRQRIWANNAEQKGSDPLRSFTANNDRASAYVLSDSRACSGGDGGAAPMRQPCLLRASSLAMGHDARKQSHGLGYQRPTKTRRRTSPSKIQRQNRRDSSQARNKGRIGVCRSSRSWYGHQPCLQNNSRRSKSLICSFKDKCNKDGES